MEDGGWRMEDGGWRMEDFTFLGESSSPQWRPLTVPQGDGRLTSLPTGGSLTPWLTAGISLEDTDRGVQMETNQLSTLYIIIRL